MKQSNLKPEILFIIAICFAVTVFSAAIWIMGEYLHKPEMVNMGRIFCGLSLMSLLACLIHVRMCRSADTKVCTVNCFTGCSSGISPAICETPSPMRSGIGLIIEAQTVSSISPQHGRPFDLLPTTQISHREHDSDMTYQNYVMDFLGRTNQNNNSSRPITAETSVEAMTPGNPTCAVKFNDQQMSRNIEGLPGFDDAVASISPPTVIYERLPSYEQAIYNVK
ncbi:uncharacterized protein LOC144342272 [Saccoglossus kowalevskii]